MTVLTSPRRASHLTVPPVTRLRVSISIVASCSLVFVVIAFSCARDAEQALCHRNCDINGFQLDVRGDQTTPITPQRDVAPPRCPPATLLAMANRRALR